MSHQFEIKRHGSNMCRHMTTCCPSEGLLCLKEVGVAQSGGELCDANDTRLPKYGEHCYRTYKSARMLPCDSRTAAARILASCSVRARYELAGGGGQFNIRHCMAGLIQAMYHKPSRCHRLKEHQPQPFACPEHQHRTSSP